jgi:hypothetical protein
VIRPPPFSSPSAAVTGHKGLPESRIRGGTYESMGESILPRTPMPKRTTNATQHTAKHCNNALSTAQVDRKCSSRGNEYRRPAGSCGARQAVTPPIERFGSVAINSQWIFETPAPYTVSITEQCTPRGVTQDMPNRTTRVTPIKSESHATQNSTRATHVPK